MRLWGWPSSKRALAACVLSAAVLAGPVAPAAAQPGAAPDAPPVPAEACRGLSVATLASGEVICSHGPDEAHPLAEESTDDGSSASATSGIACIGDGRSGTRVQAMYVRASDRPDRYATYVDSIRSMVSGVDATVAESAMQLGYSQQVRWAHNTATPCQPTVLNVVLGTDIDDSSSTALRNTISGLRALGYDDPSRKYLVFVDAATVCGQAQIYSDDSAASTNRNNGGVAGMVARVDLGYSGCANVLTATHELIHTFGGVQLSAPHSTGTYSDGTGGWHCNDEYDALCYPDGGSTGTSAHMTYSCGSTHGRLLDCNDDDYYHPAPPSSSYLAKHWNTARSSWLTSPVSVGSLLPPSGVAAKAGDGSATVAWSAPLSDGGSAITGYTVTAGSGGPSVTVPATSTSATLAGLADGVYSFTVTATNSEGKSSTSLPSAPLPLYRGGYVVDAWGAVHRVSVAGNPAPPAPSGGPYWKGWDIARGLAVRSTGGGYVVDGWGGLHPFSTGGVAPPKASNGPYWKGWDIVRGAASHPAGGGYVVDGWGALHPFSTGGVAPATASHGPYWKGWDVVRGVVVHPAGGGYVLDAWGVLHPFRTDGKAPPPVTITGYWEGWDIARGVVMLRDGSGGYVVDGWGGRHPFATGSNPLPPLTSGPYWAGADTVRDAAF